MLTCWFLASSFKGLVVDLEEGNLVKLAEDGTVLRWALAVLWTLFDLLPKNVLFLRQCYILLSQNFKNWTYYGGNDVFFFLVCSEQRMEPVSSARKRSSSTTVRKGSGSTLTAWIPPSRDLVFIIKSSLFSVRLAFFFFSYLDFFVLITFVLVLTAKYYFYDNYFDLPGALLCGRVVDMLNKVAFHF